jgi:hypothetical protein
MRALLLFLTRLQAALLPVSEPLGLILLLFLLGLLLSLVHAPPLLVLPLPLRLIFLFGGLFGLGVFRLGFIFGLVFLGAWSLFGWLLGLGQLVLEGLGEARQGDAIQRVFLIGRGCCVGGPEEGTERYAHFSLEQGHGFLRHPWQVSI